MPRHLLAAILALAIPATAVADPCGMVPPIWTGQGPAITRVGEQMTYVFFKDGVETFVIRPGFSGKVDNFGMLIPFPAVPAMRKVPDEIFTHIQAAVDPPEIIVDLNPRPERKYSRRSRAPSKPSKKSEGLSYDTVRVIKQEAIGMYEVTVLEAGSAAALKRWMDQNGYRYPKGMDAPVNDYVALGWPFVAVKTRVGSKPQITPRPGMREADATLPPGSSFDGKVQGMGFRFRVDAPVVPMRLSAFNEGELHNIVYFLGERPVRINDIDTALVRRQLPGKQLYRNVVDPLPVRILGGTLSDVSREAFDGLDPRRDPEPHNGQARQLFASDLYAVTRGELALPFEEREKVLLRIGEALNLRGDRIDHLHHDALAVEAKQTLGDAARAVGQLTMTVVDGDFPRQLLADTNLTFRGYRMPKANNRPEVYDAKTKGPSPRPNGVVVHHPQRPPAGNAGNPDKMRWFRSW